VHNDELLDALSNLIADRTHPLRGQPLRVGKPPIFPLQVGHEWARLTAPHRHQERRLTGKLGCKATGLHGTQVDADLAHGVYDFDMNTLCGLRPC